MIAGDETLINRKSTVVFHHEWHKGVLGIVASRLTDTYYRPTIVLTESDGKLTGSARSVKNFDLYEAIYECRDLLIQFGGHKYAAGLTMLPENALAFRNRFDEVVSARITPEQLIPELEIDAEIELEYINPIFYGIIQQMAPYGPENMKPVFVTRGVKDSSWSKIVKEEHIKFSVKKNNSPVIDGIGFRLAPKFDIVKNGTFYIAYNIDENVCNDKVSLQMFVRDVAEAHILAAQLKKDKHFDIYIISCNTPFLKSDCRMLFENPEVVIRERQPWLAQEFDKRGWKFPKSIDRVYDSSYAQQKLNWRPERDAFDVIKQFDNDDFETLPCLQM